MNKIIKEIIFSGLLMSIVAGCSDGNKNMDKIDSEKLYSEEKNLLQKYTDSLRQMPDSGDVSGLIERYQVALMGINSKYTSEADLEMTQGENDTIYMMTKNLYELARNKGYSRDTVINEVSIMTDSI
ncbi:MAG: hypothetical protein NC201_01050 [Prevotella sp.]|nr:hypothetical protein [Bacteroides sp.]MCM1365814.1 hypothetical protein [Prevotella sp.]MCM1436494.1 hypothetical protein [Prevotella sp.]